MFYERHMHTVPQIIRPVFSSAENYFKRGGATFVATYTQQPTPEHKRHLRVGVARPQLPAKQKGGVGG